MLPISRSQGASRSPVSLLQLTRFYHFRKSRRLGHVEIGKLYRSHPQVYTLLVLNIAREISRRLRAADQLLADLGVSLPEMWASERGPGGT
jgi:hypothetical protein